METQIIGVGEIPPANNGAATVLVGAPGTQIVSESTTDTGVNF